MANYWADFEAYTAGDDATVDGAAEWTRRWHAPSLDVVSLSSPPTGYTKGVTLDKGSASRDFWSLDAVDSDADRATVKVAALIRHTGQPAIVVAGGGPSARGSGGTNSETGVAGTLRTNPEGLNINEYDNASGSSTANTYAWVDSDWYWLVLEADGTSVTLTLYAENDGGGTALTSRSITTSITAAGWVGLFSFGSTFTDVEVAAVEVATGTSTLNYADSSDTTAPTLSSASGTATGSTTADLDVSTDEGNGTLYAVVTQSATAPSVAQVKAGQDHAGSAADFDTSQAVSATGNQDVSATGLSASTTYYAYFVHTDAASNDSSVASAASFTTTAAAVKGIQLSLKEADGTTAAASLSGLYYHVWDALNPGGASDDDGSAETTDASGVLEININSFTASIGGEVFLFVYSLDGTEDKDSVCFAGRVPVVDIS